MVPVSTNLDEIPWCEAIYRWRILRIRLRLQQYSSGEYVCLMRDCRFSKVLDAAGNTFSWHLGEIKILNVVAELSMAWDKLVTIVLLVSPLSPNVLTSRPETGFCWLQYSISWWTPVGAVSSLILFFHYCNTKNLLWNANFTGPKLEDQVSVNIFVSMIVDGRGFDACEIHFRDWWTDDGPDRQTRWGLHP